MAKLFFARGEKQAKKLAYQYQKGELNRIRRGIYVDVENEDEVAKTLESKWYEIARYIFVEPIAIARTAVELKPAGGRLYLVSSRVTARRTVDVGHLRFLPPVCHRPRVQSNSPKDSCRASIRCRRSRPSRPSLCMVSTTSRRRTPITPV